MEQVYEMVREVTETYIIPYGTELTTAWIGAAFVVFAVLTSGVLKASYGRHHSENTFFPTINGKLGWMVQELVSPIFVWLYYQAYKEPAPTISKGSVLLMSWLVHYTNRAVYSVIVSPGMTSTRIDTVIMAILFNIVTPAWCAHDFAKETSPLPLTLQTLLGLTIFFFGMAMNISSDAHLRTLRRRRGKTGEYVLPEWGLYRYIVSPNYLGEMIEWTGFAILLGRLSGWVFLLWTVCNLAPRARSHLKWYRERFGDRVGDRSGIIPGVY
jgi:3-oxo-5-alpha-steroid 4-dehydrogenase 1